LITMYQVECLPLMEAIKENFAMKVGRKLANGCTNWEGVKDGHGYGSVVVPGVSRLAKSHRVSWILANRMPIPVDRPVILHSCDNPACVNPDHLRCGTQLENIADSVAKNRNSAGIGEGHGNVKLTEEKVIEIRKQKAQGATCKALSRIYGVGDDQICRICTRKSWAHVS